MYTLYWETLSGSIGPHVMLEELGVEYTLRHIDMARGEHRAESYKAICPSMRIPALKFADGVVIGETSAIMLTLGERHPDAELLPLPGSADKPVFLYWLLHMATQGYPTFSRSWHPEQFTDDPNGEAGIKCVADANLDAFFQSIEEGIEGSTTFLKRGFTCLDIYLCMLTLWMPDRPSFLANYPKIERVCSGVERRRSYQTVAQLHGLLEETINAD